MAVRAADLRRPMGPGELLEVLGACGWHVRRLIDVLGVPKAEAYAWAYGKREVPREVAAWLRMSREAIEGCPPPVLKLERKKRGRPPGQSYVLELLRLAGGPATIQELCELAPHAGRTGDPKVIWQILTKLVGRGQVERIAGVPVRYEIRTNNLPIR